MSGVRGTLCAGVDEAMKVGDIYRTYERNTNMLHWRVNGEASLAMLCGRGDFLSWAVDTWNSQNEVNRCQECEVLYVLEAMGR